MNIEFTAKCPNCNGQMAEGNKFCCHKCFQIDAWKKAQEKNKKR